MSTHDNERTVAERAADQYAEAATKTTLLCNALLNASAYARRGEANPEAIKRIDLLRDAIAMRIRHANRLMRSVDDEADRPEPVNGRPVFTPEEANEALDATIGQQAYVEFTKRGDGSFREMVVRVTAENLRDMTFDFNPKERDLWPAVEVLEDGSTQFRFINLRAVHRVETSDDIRVPKRTGPLPSLAEAEAELAGLFDPDAAPNDAVRPDQLTSFDDDSVDETKEVS
jgi:hypothetical protein